MASAKEKQSKIYIGNINKQATETETRKMILGTGLSDSQITGIWLKRGYAFIECADQATADMLIDKLDGFEFQGQKISVQPSVQSPTVTSGILPGSKVNRLQRSLDIQPSLMESLRILVPSDYVGAIIGRGGNNIKELTTSTGARINILRNRSQSLNTEKTVCIMGSPAKCSEACRKILEVCADEAAATTIEGAETPEVSLKILAYNSLIGKIIGKDGRNIKKIMLDSGTRIHVSNQVQNDSLDSGSLYGSFIDVERVITVRGSIEGMSKAEMMISSKLRMHPMSDVENIQLGGLGQRLIPATGLVCSNTGIPISLVTQWGSPLTKIAGLHVTSPGSRSPLGSYKLNSRVH